MVVKYVVGGYKRWLSSFSNFFSFFSVVKKKLHVVYQSS